MKPYALGFMSVPEEYVFDVVPVSGTMPLWLRGTLLRNGPARFETRSGQIDHWFDGFAMILSFTFGAGNVSFNSHMLKTNYLAHANKAGSLSYGTFASDPCRSIFSAFFSTLISRGIQDNDNANVNITRLSEAFIAMTEIPLPVEFDIHTLKTLGTFNYDDVIKGQVTTAHPHYDSCAKESINYVVSMGRNSFYTIYGVKDGERQRRIIAQVPVKNPAYMHSFAITRNYVILAEYPLCVNPVNLLYMRHAFIKNYRWQPELGTRFLVVSRITGELVAEIPAPAFFAFHHANAFEQNGNVVLDLVAYEDPSIIDAFYYNEQEHSYYRPLSSSPALARWELDLNTKTASGRIVSQEFIEFPRINYDAYSTRKYSYVYGVSSSNTSEYPHQLIKMSVPEGSVKKWEAQGCFPGEPVFVAAPDACKEDDGVILSIVLDAVHQQTFLLVLDAETFSEVARATVPAVIPFGLHGNFYPFDS